MLDSLSLHNSIEEIVRTSGTDYIDAIIHFCAVNDLEVETIGAIISKDLNLVSKIQLEAEDLHYLRRESQLPI
jgi:hypothetical protein